MTQCQNILIVDASPAERQAIIRLLQGAPAPGYEVLEAATGAEALALCRERPVDCVLLGEPLPDRDQLALLRAFGEDASLRDIPVAVLVSLGGEAAAAQALRLGARDYLIRGSTSAEELAQVIAGLVAWVALVRRRDQQQEELREREALLRDAIETMLDCFGIYTAIRDKDGGIVDFRIEYVNDAACVDSRLTREEHVGRALCEVLPGHRASGLFDEYCQVVASGQPMAKEALTYGPVIGGRYLTRLVDVRVNRRGDGVVAVWRDISASKRSEHERLQLLGRERVARQAAEEASLRLERLQALTAALSAAMTVAHVARAITDQGVITLGAQSCGVSLLSEDGAELVSAPSVSSDAGSPSLRIPLTSASPMAKAVRSGQIILIESRADLQARFQEPSSFVDWRSGEAGVAIPLLVKERTLGCLAISYGEPRRFAEEEQAFLLLIGSLCAQALERARLYEAEQRARAAAEAAVRVRDQFLSVAAHELKGPVTVLLGNAQLLDRRAKHEGGLPERSQSLLRGMAEQAWRLDTMISDLLDVSRIEQGQLQIHSELLNLDALLAEVVAEIEPTLTKHSLIVSGLEWTWPVMGDPLRLAQAFRNLLGNAVKYSPLGGAIVVRVEERNGQAVVSISDQGIGIPSQSLPRLFQHFSRAANTALWRIRGTGIGLYVVAEVVKRHGGGVSVTSTEGEGSTFTVTLPLARHGDDAE